MFKRKTDPNIQSIGEYAGYFGAKRDLDVVIFVHGITGHFRKTWGIFPELLASDPDIPELDILLWGYKTSAVRPFVDDTATVGRQLVSSLRVQVDDLNAIHAVGHSMGGLIILEGLTSEMEGLRAQHHPCKAVGFITLYASPVTGSMAGAILDSLVSWIPGARLLVNRQLKSLAKGQGIEGLLLSVRDRIFTPKGNDSSMRRIPIRMVMGSSDGAVSASDRNFTYATYNDPAPLEYPFGHSAIKMPPHRLDDRYLALAKDLKASLLSSFHRLCNEAMSTQKATKNNAEHEIERRYGEMFHRRFYDRYKYDWPAGHLYRFYRELIIEHGASSALPPHDIADRVLLEMQRRGLL